MGASAFTVSEELALRLGNKEIDIDGDTMVARLYSSASNIAASISDATTITNELATANGYTNGGATLANKSWTEAAGVATFDADDVTWNASGGNITARFLGIVDTTTTPDRLICFCLLDDTPADVTATDGNPLTVQFSANGLFQVS